MTTRTQEWHADRALLSRYLAGALDAVTGASVEQHVSQPRSFVILGTVLSALVVMGW